MCFMWAALEQTTQTSKTNNTRMSHLKWDASSDLAQVIWEATPSSEATAHLYFRPPSS